MNIATSLSADSQVTGSSVDVMRVGEGLPRKAGLASLLFACFLAAGCGSSGDSAITNAPPAVGASCSVAQHESDMDSILSGVSSDVDFSFAVERQDGRRYSYSRGASTLQTSYESASTSKLVSAVIILRQVERGYLNLLDTPQRYITPWPILSTDPLFNMTLGQLLSFTSGLATAAQSEQACLSLGGANFESCVNNIANAQAGNGVVPGQQFYYSSNHLQVAGLMAVKARGVPVATWQDLFTEFKAQTGLFTNSAYDLPSVTNPRLAGGMHWTGEEYMAFLKALKDGTLLNASSMNQLVADHTASATIAYSPIALAIPNGLGENWHYGFGLWNECQVAANAPFTCMAGTRVSSPGAYGAYPFWDRSKNYFGIVARQGTLGTFPNGIAIERAVRSTVEQWAACP